jgi:colanic acid biosynthesis glycosyl transferase WcaI
MKKARILLLGGNYFPEPTGIGKYNGEMMEWLASQGHECAVITTYPYYPFWKAQDPYTKSSYRYTKEETVYNDSKLKVYRCPHYIPKNPSAVNRMTSDLSFFISAFFPLFGLLFRKRYDYVITVVPFFKMGLLALLYKWIKGAKFVYHIQDLQIDAAKELKMINSEMLFRMMFRVEKYILCKADFVSSISDGMINKIKMKCGRPVVFFPNWVDTQVFYPLANKNELKQQFGFSTSEKVVLYSGAIGNKQGLEAILFAARDINRPNVKFVICGSGPYKEILNNMRMDMKLENVVFLPLQPKEKLNEFLNMADVHLVLQKANANDLVMPSKLTNIFSVGGLALVAASEESSLHAIVSRHNMAILLEPENASALTDSIRYAVDNDHRDVKSNARRFATQYLTIDKVMNLFLNEISISKQLSPTILNRKEHVESKARVESNTVS